MELSGPIGERFDAGVKNWLIPAPYANPGMLQMYFRRNLPHQEIMEWYGEFAGKWLTGAALCYAMKPDEDLRRAADYVTETLCKAQDEDGYLGVWPDDTKYLEARHRSGRFAWDLWSHYHNMLGLYYWNKVSGNEIARTVLIKAADGICNFFDDPAKSVVGDKTNTAIGHIFTLLYKETGNTRYLNMAEKVIECLKERGPYEEMGDFLRDGFLGIPFYQMKNNRWECLHVIQSLAEMYKITGDDSYKVAFKNIWESIRAYDRHNNGAFSSDEHGCGSPFHTGFIETCCDIAWMALSMDMLELTDDPAVADELEFTTLNAFLGCQHPSGRFFTYNTPMLGDRQASAHQIVFQSRAGSPELNCCSVNGARGFGMIGQWGVTVRSDTLTVNWYGASTTRRELQSGKTVTLVQEGDYPFGNKISMRLKAKGGSHCCLRLRIPSWSAHTRVTRNGKEVQGVESGSYMVLPGVRTGEHIAIEFDMSPHFWVGEEQFAGRASIYYGPIVLALDERYQSDAMTADTPVMDLSTLELSPIRQDDGVWPQPILQFSASDASGNRYLLCDFASAGSNGTSYTTWIPAGSPAAPSAGGPYSLSWLFRP